MEGQRKADLIFPFASEVFDKNQVGGHISGAPLLHIALHNQDTYIHTTVLTDHDAFDVRFE